MKISRRSFVGTASCAAASVFCAIPSLSSAATDSRSARATHYSLLDLKSQCVLPESLEGYRRALGDERRSLSEIELEPRDGHRSIVVPAAGAIGASTANALFAAVSAGATVLWESGAAFLSASDFAAQQALLHEHFTIAIGQPTDLWCSKSPKRISADCPTNQSRKSKQLGHDSVPYVAYHWPHETRVRDFSRAIPVTAKTGHAIARLGDVAVAWRKPIGRGTFIFLGSPIGPAIRAGDAEAHAWLRAVIAEAV